MKTYLVVLGLLFLLKNEVSPLTCFMCENQPTNLRCLRFRECSEEEVFCVTAVASYEFGMMTFKKRITKRCSAFCPDLQMALGFASFGTSCCQRSWCNIWGSLGERNATQGWEWPTIDLTRSFDDGT
ncbi:lymphocyte antigen 6E-like [Pantherophis guttatus]|uniref:Lymphocyte antigen 6E-like n=1 Tax=Pantherophis guttatus TaxID=94885 RepID=A0A6P9C8D7_PANGU|nr:lymphocyte antigen 6E-like [Pantherophis guttatus]